MKYINLKLTRTKYALRLTGIVTAFLTTTNSIHIAILTIIAVFAPFSHLFYLHSEKEGLFGFAYMSSFLFSLGFPIMITCLGFLLKISIEKGSDLRMPFKIISDIVIGVGLFFLVYTLMPSKDFSNLTYYTAVIIISVFLSVALIWLHKLTSIAENQLKKTIRELFSFIIETVPDKYVQEDSKIAYQEEYENLIDKLE